MPYCLHTINIFFLFAFLHGVAILMANSVVYMNFKRNTNALFVYVVNTIIYIGHNFRKHIAM